jgi:hypothetical protein
MAKLNWRSHGSGSYSYLIAHAARGVGGKYRIQQYQSNSGGPDYFDIRYLYSTGRGAWNSPNIGKVGSHARGSHGVRASRS